MKHNGLYIILATVIAFALLLTGCGSVGQTVEDVAQEEAVEQIEIVEAEIDEKDGEDVQPEMEEIGDKAEPVEASDADVREAAAEVQTDRQTESTVANVNSGTADASGGAQYPVIGGSESVDEDSGSHGVIGVTGGGGQGVHVHNYSRQVVAPTCSQQGYTVFTCSCGDSYIGNYTPATGQHRWVLDYAEVPVYEKRGIHVCNVCGKDITDMTLGDHYFIDGCLGSWRSATIQVEVGTSYEVVGCHCGDCGKVAGE